MKRIFFLSLIGCFLFAADAIAGKRYWVSATAAYWNNTANWSTSSGGAGGASVPGSSDTAYFDANAVGDDTIDANVNIKRWEIAAGYTGTIVQRTYTMTIGTSGAVLSGGTFAGGSANITFSGACTISGCAFTSTSGTFSTSSNFTVSSGSFTHNSGKFVSTATSTISGTITFHKLFLSPTATATYTVSNTITVEDTLKLTGSVNISINTGNIDAKGNISVTNSGLGGGTGKIRINGTADQYFSSSGAGHLPDIVINKSSGTLYLSGFIAVAGDWTWTAGTVDAQTSTVYMYGAKTITGAMTFYNLRFAGSGIYTIASGTTITVGNTLSCGSGGSWPVLNTGTINVSGDADFTQSNSGSGGGTATIVFNGSGDQTLTGSGTYLPRLCNVQINKSSGTFYVSSTIIMLGNWTYTAGTVSSSSSALYFAGNRTISGTHTLNSVTLDGSSAYTYTIASGTTLTLAGNLVVNGSNAVTINTGTINVEGNITISNTSTGSGGSATIAATGSNDKTLTGSGAAGEGRLPNIVIDKSGGTLTLASVISVAGDWTYTAGTVSPGTSTVAFYGTKNLDGQISGAATMMPFNDVTINGNTRTLTGNLDVNGNFTIASGATCSAGSNTVYVGGDWNSAGTWTYGTSTVVFDGNGYNKIEGAAGVINFASVQLNRRTSLGSTPKNLRLLNPVKINTGMTFVLGRLKTTTTNYLEFADNATCTVSNDDSAYVHGPVRKTGDDAFSFPLGDTTLHDSIAYHPLAITAPGSTSDRFEAVYNAIGQTLGSTIVDSLYDLSTCEKWSLERQQGTSDVLVTLSWNRNSCNTDVYGNMRVANWDGSGWSDLGASAISALYGGKGTVTSSGNPTYVSNFAYLTTAVAKNNFPTAILTKKLDGSYYKAINGRLFFRFDEEYYDTGDLTFNIYDDEHTLVSSNSMMPSTAQPQVVYGDNRFRLNTVGCEITPSGPLADGFYILEVINDKNEKWYLRFEQDANIMIGNCPPPTEAE